MGEKIAEMPKNEQEILHELDTRRLDWLITESNEAWIDWLSDSFWDAIEFEDGMDVLAAARKTIDAAMNEEQGVKG